MRVDRNVRPGRPARGPQGPPRAGRDAGGREAGTDGRGASRARFSFQNAASSLSAAKPSVTAPVPTFTMPVMLIGASWSSTACSAQVCRSEA